MKGAVTADGRLERSQPTGLPTPPRNGFLLPDRMMTFAWRSRHAARPARTWGVRSTLESRQGRVGSGDTPPPRSFPAAAPHLSLALSAVLILRLQAQRLLQQPELRGRRHLLAQFLGGRGGEAEPELRGY